MAAVLACAAVIGLAASAAAPSSATHRIPGSVADDCSVDVTRPLLSWITSVPNHSTLAFKRGACYRIDGTLVLRNRSGLKLEGNGATFRAKTTGGSHRAHWQVVDGSGIAFRDMTVRGPRTEPRFVYGLQWQHAFDVRGTSGLTLERVRAFDVYGDCFYIGRGWDNRRAWAQGVRIRNSVCVRTGRMGAAVTAGSDVRVERSAFRRIGLSVFDVEPNGHGYGAENVSFTGNRVGRARDYVFVVTGRGPVDGVIFSRNTVVGNRMRVGAFGRGGERPSNIHAIDNTADTGYYEENGAAMRFVAVDGVVVTGNTVPLSSPNTVLVDAADACNVKVFGNAFPGGVAEARIRTAVCPSSVSGAMSDVLGQRSSLRRSTRVGGVAHRRSFGVAGT